MKISFHTHTVHIMAGGKSHGTLTRWSLPGDKPEVWTVAFIDPDGVVSDDDKRHGLSAAFASRHDAEMWALPHAIRLAEAAEHQRVRADGMALAELALT